jgi:RNA 3'-terminal phosphate cyclase (ATP)
VFEPGEVVPGKYTFSIGTAGATGLVLHTLYLPLAVGQSVPSELTILGGTHVTASPCFQFLDVTWRPYLELLGLRIGLHLRRPGFYPRGGGVIEAHIQPCPELRGFDADVSPADRIMGISAVAGLPEQIAQRQARRACHRLRDLGLKVDIAEESGPGGPGTVLALELNTKPVPTLFFGLGARGKPAERVADEAVDLVVAYVRSEQCGVDPHSADQLVLPLALSREPSVFRTTAVTSHLLTNIAVIGRFVERTIQCQGEEGKTGTVRIS